MLARGRDRRARRTNARRHERQWRVDQAIEYQRRQICRMLRCVLVHECMNGNGEWTGPLGIGNANFVESFIYLAKYFVAGMFSFD